MNSTEASAGRKPQDARLALLQLRGDLLGQAGAFFQELQQQHQLKMEHSCAAAEEEVGREAAAAHWRRLICSIHLLQQQLAAARAAQLSATEAPAPNCPPLPEQCEEAEALQADIGWELLAAEALSEHWGGFTEQERFIDGLEVCVTQQQEEDQSPAAGPNLEPTEEERGDGIGAAAQVTD
eukprot:gene1894-2228_t